MSVGSSTGTWETYQWLFPLPENNSTSPSIHQLPIAPQLEVRCQEFLLLSLCRSCVNNYSHFNFKSAAATSCQEDSIPQQYPHPPGLTSFYLLFHNVPWALFHRGANIDALAMAEQSPAPIPRTVHSCVSVLTTTHCDQNLLWPRLKAAQVYGYKLTYLECSLTTWAFIE